MGTETWIISLPLSDSILYLKIIHPPNFRESHIFGGYNHRYYANKLAASASDNHISMENGTSDSHGGSVSMIAGDMENAESGSSTMTNNTITISGGSINAAEDGSTGGDINIAGAYSDSSGASSNEVNISRGTIGTASGVISISGAAAYSAVSYTHLRAHETSWII